MNICAFTCVCEEDAGWAAQYLREVERLEMPFCILFDRCSDGLKRRFVQHGLCHGFCWQDDPTVEFTERIKQKVFDLILGQGFYWAMAWDIDETLERDAPAKLREIAGNRRYGYATVQWVNCWGDSKHIRTDGMFSNSRRVKFYNIEDYGWAFTHDITNGAKPCRYGSKYPMSRGEEGTVPLLKTNLVCLHYGLMTHELRVQHKRRWDRIYSTALKGDPNPYGIWDHALNEFYVPTIEENPYL